MRQALAGMLWSKQFYHYDVDKWLEERGSDPFKATRKAAPRNDHWHHMYNGDVISMPDKWEYPWYAAWDLAFHVARPDAGGPGLRQAATEADAARALHAPQRPDSRPTSGTSATSTRRCMPGPPSSPTAWKRRRRGEGDRDWLKSMLPEAAAELHLVGQPQGPLRAERLRGRLPGPGQHRRVRSQRPAADRRLPGTGRRHRLDGPLLPEHARNRRRAGDDRSGLRGHGPQVHRALPVDRLGDGAPGRRHGHVGRGGRLLLRRAPAARRPGPAAQGAVHGRPPAPVRGHGLRRGADREVPRTGGAVPVVPRRAPRTVRRDPRPEEARRRRPPARFHPGRNQAPPRAGQDARRERVPQPVRHPLAVALSRRPSLRHPRGRPGIPVSLSAGGVGHRHVRRQLQLARPHLDAGQRS